MTRSGQLGRRAGGGSRRGSRAGPEAGRTGGGPAGGGRGQEGGSGEGLVSQSPSPLPAGRGGRTRAAGR